MREEHPKERFRKFKDRYFARRKEIDLFQKETRNFADETERFQKKVSSFITNINPDKLPASLDTNAFIHLMNVAGVLSTDMAGFYTENTSFLKSLALQQKKQTAILETIVPQKLSTFLPKIERDEKEFIILFNDSRIKINNSLMKVKDSRKVVQTAYVKFVN